MPAPGDRPVAPALSEPMVAGVAEADVCEFATDALVVNLFKDVSAPGGATGAVDRALAGQISRLIASGDVTGDLGATAVLYPTGGVAARRVIVVGLGESGAFSLEAVRRAAASALVTAERLGASDLATIAHGAGIGGLEPDAAAQATLEGSLLAGYTFAGWRRAASEGRVRRLTLIESDSAKVDALRAGAQAANAVYAGVSLARDLVNLPPNVATPSYLASRAVELAQASTLQVEVGDLAWAEERAMGAFLAIARGSANPPAFIRLEHNRSRDDLPTVVLVGKGVTFDTGGISLKNRDGMGRMKGDMGGAAAVIGALAAVAALELPLHVVGLCPCVENMPDGGAYRPSDVVVASNGVSIEILSTDAEGRLALADALVHAQEYRPAAVIDIATLTGSSVTALGEGVSSSLFASDDVLAQSLLDASEASGETTWRMPLFDEYRESIKGKVVADIKNSGGAKGGVGTSAVFLQEFTDYRWAHIDMAGMEMVDRRPAAKPYLTAGGTGYGVRLLVSYLRDAARRALP